jgi:hypothetical protein
MKQKDSVLCVNCSKEIDFDCKYDPGRLKVVGARYQYNQVSPQCEKHFLILKDTI